MKIYPWLYDKLMKGDAYPMCPFCPARFEFPEMVAHLRLNEGMMADEAQEIIERLMLETEVDENGEPIRREQ